MSPQSNIRRSLPGALAAQSGDSANSSRALGDRAASARTFADRRKDDEKLGERLREGTRITDVQGSFPFFGDRVAFYPDHLG